MQQKKRRTLVLLFSVPLDVLFSKEFQDDLMRIWNLRYLIPDPEIYNKDASQPTFHCWTGFFTPPQGLDHRALARWSGDTFENKYLFIPATLTM